MLEYKPREVVISGFQIKADRLHHDCFFNVMFNELAQSTLYRILIQRGPNKIIHPVIWQNYSPVHS